MNRGRRLRFTYACFFDVRVDAKLLNDAAELIRGL